MQIPFCGAAYSDRTIEANAQVCINYYPMRSPESGMANQGQPPRIILYPTPGYSLMYDVVASSGILGVGAIRGTFVINSVLFVISGTQLLKITVSAGVYTPTALGTLITSTGRCSISCNTVELTISDGLYGYTYNLGSTAFAQITVAGSWPATNVGVTNLAFIDGYTLAAVNGTSQLIQSNLLASGTWGALAFVNVNSFPDNLVAVFSDQLQLYVFGPKVTEVRYDAASTPFAFAKVGGVLIQAGCVAWPTIVKVGNTIIWLAQDVAGKSYVAALTGYATKVLSTPPINEAMERYTTLTDAFAYTYREGDNQFYSITFPTANVTWVMDVATNLWHQRSVGGGRDLPDHYATWNNSHVVGDSTGKLWLMSQDYQTDNAGMGLKRVRTCQHIKAEDKITFLDELQIDIEAGTAPLGVNTVNPSSPADSAPLATLEISKDSGHTWINCGTKDFGSQGQYSKRLIWRRLGYSRNGWTFRLTITDTVRTYILGAFAKIRVGSK